MKATGEASVESDPPGADVSIRPYGGDANAWESLGKTPLQKVRVPSELYVWRIAKPGFAPESFLRFGPPVEWTSEARPDGQRSARDGPRAGRTELASDARSTTLPGRSSTTTDRPARGHQRGVQEVRRRRRLPEARVLEAALPQGRPDDPVGRGDRLFRDATGRPGPATWELGSFPKGLGEAPGRRRQLVRGRRVRRVRGQEPSDDLPLDEAAQTGFSHADRSGEQLPGRRDVAGRRARHLSGFGTTDMAGNVKEWCWNESSGGKRYILGGGFGEPTYMFIDPDAQSPWDRRPNYGFRCVKLVRRPAAGRGRENRAPVPRLLEGEAGLRRGLPRLQGALRLRQGRAERASRGDARRPRTGRGRRSASTRPTAASGSSPTCFCRRTRPRRSRRSSTFPGSDAISAGQVRLASSIGTRTSSRRAAGL